MNLALTKTKMYLLDGFEYLIYMCMFECVKKQTRAIKTWSKDFLKSEFREFFLNFSHSVHQLPGNFRIFKVNFRAWTGKEKCQFISLIGSGNFFFMCKPLQIENISWFRKFQNDFFCSVYSKVSRTFLVQKTSLRHVI